MEKPTIIIDRRHHRQYSDLVSIAFSMLDGLSSKLTIMGELSPTEEQWLNKLGDALGEVDLPALEALQQFYREMKKGS